MTARCRPGIRVITDPGTHFSGLAQSAQGGYELSAAGWMKRLTWARALVPEYTGSVLEFVSLGHISATASVAATARSLARAMAITGRPIRRRGRRC
jgi:hypothetical protein